MKRQPLGISRKVSIQEAYRHTREKKIKKVREGQTVDALALGGDEGRDKLRKAWGRCK